jgi:hypothetical protein
MFGETNINSFHTDRVFGRFKLVVVDLLADGTNWTVVAASSSPGVATTANTTTVALTGLPTGANYWFPGQPDTINSAVTLAITAQDAAAGTLTLTASAATNGVRAKWFFLVNRTG